MGNRLPSWLQPGIRDVVPEAFETVRGRLGAQGLARVTTPLQRARFARIGGLASAAALGPGGRSLKAYQASQVRQLKSWLASYPDLIEKPEISCKTFRVLDLFAGAGKMMHGLEVVRALAGVLSMGHVYGVLRYLVLRGWVVLVEEKQHGAHKKYLITARGVLEHRRFCSMIGGGNG